ncbi:MAG: hypothetical protein EOO44_09060 [Flavobacterium sp.]|nr:MAG: hypothetical protein EOO44_09060 [Flavobacterium sp.]
MILISTPNWGLGKLLLEYNGCNKLINPKLNLQTVSILETHSFDANIDFPLAINIQLFDNSELFISLGNPIVYRRTGNIGANNLSDWHEIDDGFFFQPLAIMDREYIILKGSISFNKNVDEHESYLESYSLTLICKRTDTLLLRLEKVELYPTGF